MSDTISEIDSEDVNETVIQYSFILCKKINITQCTQVAFAEHTVISLGTILLSTSLLTPGNKPR